MNASAKRPRRRKLRAGRDVAMGRRRRRKMALHARGCERKGRQRTAERYDHACRHPHAPQIPTWVTRLSDSGWQITKLEFDFWTARPTFASARPNSQTNTQAIPSSSPHVIELRSRETLCLPASLKRDPVLTTCVEERPCALLLIHSVRFLNFILLTLHFHRFPDPESELPGCGPGAGL